MGSTSSRLALLWPLAAVLATGCAPLGQFAAAPRSGNASASNERPFALARLTERKGKLTDAEQMYHSLQARNTRDPAIEHRLGVVAARQGKLEEARQHFN